MGRSVQVTEWENFWLLVCVCSSYHLDVRKNCNVNLTTFERINSVFIFIFHLNKWFFKKVLCCPFQRYELFLCEVFDYFLMIRIKFTANFTVSIFLQFTGFFACKILGIFCLQNYWSNHRRWKPCCTLYMFSAFMMKYHPPEIIV